MLNYNKIQVGDEVKWSGSEGSDELTYTVLEKYPEAGNDTIVLIGDGYTEYEVFIWELS